MGVEQPEIFLEIDGFCPICDAPARFRSYSTWLRDHFQCEGCGSIPRQRALVAVLNIFRPEWRALKVHESSPSLAYFSQKCPHYSASFFFEDTPLGSYRDDYRCENLEAMTFSDEIFDVFITQDVMEHVFHPDRAFAEIMRVLRPKGIHIFTAPKHKHLLTSYPRALLVGGHVEHIHDPQYHGNPISTQGALVTWDYGVDFDDLIQKWSGYNTSNFIIRDRQRGIDGEYLDVFVTIKAEANRLAHEIRSVG